MPIAPPGRVKCLYKRTESGAVSAWRGPLLYGSDHERLQWCVGNCQSLAKITSMDWHPTPKDERMAPGAPCHRLEAKSQEAALPPGCAASASALR